MPAIILVTMTKSALLSLSLLMTMTSMPLPVSLATSAMPEMVSSLSSLSVARMKFSTRTALLTSLMPASFRASFTSSASDFSLMVAIMLSEETTGLPSTV